MAQGAFGTAINCIDGRAQNPVADWVKQNAHVDFVDTVTSPGPDYLLTHAQPERLDILKQMVEISIRAHGSQIVVIAGHFDCAAFPADQAQHEAAIRESMNIIADWGLPVRVVGLWVNDQWQVEIVGDSGPVAA